MDYSELNNSPFRAIKKSKTPHMRSQKGMQDFSPLKGKQDPNMASFARQNAHMKGPQIQ